MERTEFPVDITDLALPNNHGVARKDGRVIFVPGAVVGDRVRVTVTRQQKQFSYGEIRDIETPSPFRVEPGCIHFGACGGCSLQHLAYDKQLAIKEHFLSENLRRIGGIDIEKTGTLAPIVPSPDIYLYRNKIELAFGAQEGKITVGMRERVSPFIHFSARVVPITTCSIFSPAAAGIISAVSQSASRRGLTAFDPVTQKGVLKHLILRESKATGAIMAILETRAEKLPDLEGLIHDVVGAAPEIGSFYHGINKRGDDVIRFEGLRRLYGAETIEESIGDLVVRVHPGTFLQPNTKGAELLYGAVLDELSLRGNETIVGLYCGSGAIEMAVARKVRRVIGVDSDPRNIVAARENCKINQIANCTFYRCRAEDVTRNVALPKADALIVDPPRTGLTTQSLSVIKGLNLARIAYVSCNPATLARDLRDLVTHGYSVRTVRPFDLFPHTGHLETLVILVRS